MAEQQQAMMAAQMGMPPPGAGGGATVFGPMGQAGAAMDQMGQPVQDPNVIAGPDPTASAELDRQAAGEPGAVAANPWAGFWDSLFAAARGIGVQPPVTPGTPSNLPSVTVPRVSRAQLARIFQERFDQAIRVRGQTAQQFRDALESALAQQPDGRQLATTMQFLFAWKTAEPIGKAKAQLAAELRKPSANGNGVHPKAPIHSTVKPDDSVKQDLRTGLVGKQLESALEPQDGIGEAFRGAYERQTQVREQLLRALQETGLTDQYAAQPSDEINDAQEDEVLESQPQPPTEEQVHYTVALDPDTALEQYRAGTISAEELERYALEESLAGI
jgi:hypothetical protein